MASIDTDPAYRALLALSARIGADRLLVQAAGGNSSIKTADGVMWIKASGTWLADAEQRAIMVPVDYARMEAALVRGDPAAARQQDFVVAALAAGDLRPSIETSMHAVIPFRIVVHVHCVATLAYAIRADAPATIAPLLEGLDWRFIPYAKPGVALAEAIRAVPPAPVYVLANHGLVVASETVDEAASLLADIAARLDAPRRHGFAPNLARLAELTAGTNYVPAMENSLHAAGRPGAAPDRDPLALSGPCDLSRPRRAIGAARRDAARGGALWCWSRGWEQCWRATFRPPHVPWPSAWLTCCRCCLTGCG